MTHILPFCDNAGPQVTVLVNFLVTGIGLDHGLIPLVTWSSRGYEHSVCFQALTLCCTALDLKPLKMKETHFFKIPGTTYPTIHHHIHKNRINAVKTYKFQGDTTVWIQANISVRSIIWKFYYNKPHNEFHLSTYIGSYYSMLWLFPITVFRQHWYKKDIHGDKI